MAIIQISRIQQRTGNLVDLPQLDDAEFGWATDSKRLFIGKSSPNENIEVLTSYSDISFSQVTGSGNGNLNISNTVNGQLLSFDSTSNTWMNTGGNSQDPGNASYYTSTQDIHLGNVSNVKLGGGAIGYVLETDGTGNLSWTSKGTLRVDILAMDNSTPVVMTVDANTPYTNASRVTISGVDATLASIVNGQSFYIKVATNFPTTGNVKLYANADFSGPLNGTGLGYVANGIAVTSLTGSGTVSAAGADTSIQYNGNGSISGNASFTYNFTSKLMTLSGNANVGNLNATGVATATRFFSNVATGSSPLTVTSTTRVSNLNVSYSNVSDFEVVTTQTTGVFYPTFVSASSTANYALGSNANLSFNAASGTLSAILLTGTLTTAAQPNVTSVGTLTSLAVTGTATAGNLSTGGTLNVTGNANVGNLGTAGLISAAGNITGGNLVTSGQVDATGNITGGNLNTAGLITATGNITGGNLVTSGQVDATGNITGGNLNTAGLITATGNITGGNLATLGALAVNGNAYVSNISATGWMSVTGNANVGNIQGTTGYFSTISNPVTTGNVLSILGSNSTVTNAVGGGITLTAGRGNTAGSGGAVRINGGAVAGTTNAAGGLIWLTAGTSYGAPAGGGVTIQAGGSTGTGSRLTLAGGGGAVDPRGGGVELVAGASLTGTDIRGSNLTIKGGSGTGAGQPGNILFQTSNFLDSGTTPQTPSTILTVSSLGILVAGNIGVTDITSGSVDTVGNITGNWQLTSGSQLRATYADLAECYKADAHYEAGTVLEFGGMNEVTVASDATNRVAGVVSTNPAYVMNSQCEGEYIVQLALQGRAPCKVRGNVRKGDMMVSGGDGFARPSASPLMGTVIGKSLEDFTGTSGVIEVAVGRL